MPELTRVRSVLFMPGTRADMIAKIPRFAPDVAIIDLEDAVAPGDKAAARRTAPGAINAINAVDPESPSVVLVRVNPVGTPWFAADMAAAAGSAAAGVVVPKLASRPQLGQVRQALAEHSWTGALIIAGIETALGVADVRTLLTGELRGPGVPGVLSAAYFGAEDYIADIGGRRSPGGEEVLYARSQVCLAAYLAGLPAIDQVVVDIADDDQFLADARRGQSLGYQGKMCIHPRQVGLAHQVFTPTGEEVAHARAVVAVGEAGVAVVDGQMVDEVHVRMARAVLARAGGTPGPARPGDPGTPGLAGTP
jgi:citrate lyase subunit beta / citryl-CoA lyase